MKRGQLLKLISEGENFNVEFKRTFSDFEKIAKELLAFSNTRGGYLLIGVDDDGKIRGVESEKEEIELVRQSAAKYCEPPIDIEASVIEVNNKDIVLVEVPESNYKPHRIQDYQPELNINTSQVYVRVEDKSVLASKEMIKLLQSYSKEMNLNKYQIGNDEKLVFEYLDKNERITVKEFKNIANISNRRASRTLIKLVRAHMLMIHTNNNGEDFFTYLGK